MARPGRCRRYGDAMPLVATPILAVTAGPSLAVVVAHVSWPAVALGVGAVTAIALWGLFRPGSIADRARRGDPGPHTASADDSHGATAPDGSSPPTPPGDATR